MTGGSPGYSSINDYEVVLLRWVAFLFSGNPYGCLVAIKILRNMFLFEAADLLPQQFSHIMLKFEPSNVKSVNFGFQYNYTKSFEMDPYLAKIRIG